MNTALWVIQLLLALGFAASAVMKGTWDRERLVRSGQTGVQGLPILLIRLIALSEALGALGLVLPLASGMAPWLTTLAAIGLAVIMLLAAGVHITLREPRNVAVNVVIFAACLLVAFGRGLRVDV
jgi:VIT1/CCC1 family predicted Fe2+/Mn2+ transporter